MRASIAGRSSAAPTATLPGVSLYATAGVRPKVFEIGIFNTTATAFVAAIYRLSTAGTLGAGLTEVSMDDPDQTILASGFDAHSVAPTLNGKVRQAPVGAAIGAAVIFTFKNGIHIPVGTANGVGILCPTGTGQVFDYHIEWEE
jgi:hypothetical protein